MDKELAKVIGAAARRRRKALKLTQEDAAERIRVSVEFYARIERGNALPSVQTFARMTSALGISADALLGRPAPASPGDDTWLAAQPPNDPPEIRRVLRLLRKSSHSTLRLVTLLVKELEKNQSSDDGAEAGFNDTEPAELPEP